MTPDSKEAKQFWESIWSIDSTHHAEWLKKLKEEVELPQQAELSITIDMVTQFLRKVPNWKETGPDMVQGFWLKNFTGLHHNIANQLQVCLDCGNVPGWMTKGRTVLIMKDPEKGIVAGNYRPITCLPIMWKLLLTGIISDKLYEFLDTENVLPDEQKGSLGTNDQLFIDKMVLRQASLRADVSISFASSGKGRQRNAVPNRVPVSRCSGFEFRINYGVVVNVARPLNCNFYQAPVVQRVDNAIHRINHYPVDKCWQNKLHYPLDSNLSGG